MRRSISLGFAIALTGALLMSGGRGWAATPTLEAAITDATAAHTGRFTVFAQGMHDDVATCVRCDTPINAASTIKLFVLDAAYVAMQQHRLSNTDRIEIHTSFASQATGRLFAIARTDDSYEPLYKLTGTRVPVSELLRVMIQNSSNLATNLMIEKLGVDFIRNVVAQQNLEGITFGRMIEDFDANDRGIRNIVTARGLGSFLVRLDRGGIVGRRESAAMIGIMRGQTFNDIIPPGLPPGTKIAHKTGWVHGVRNDAAIVFPRGAGDYVLVLLTDGLVDEKAGIAVMNDISRLVYAGFTRSTP